MGKLCQVRTKVTCMPISMLVRTALLCLWERTYPWAGHTHTHTQTHAQPRHTRPRVPQTRVALQCHQYQMVLLTQAAACATAKGDFTPSHAFLGLMLVSLLSRQDLGKGAGENQPKGKIMTHVQPETLPDSVCYGYLLLLVTVQGRLWTCAAGPVLPLLVTVWN